MKLIQRFSKPGLGLVVSGLVMLAATQAVRYAALSGTALVVGQQIVFADNAPVSTNSPPDPCEGVTCEDSHCVTNTDGEACCESGPHNSGTFCCEQPFVLNPGTLSSTSATTCPGGWVSCPTFSGFEFGGGKLCETLTFDCDTTKTPIIYDYYYVDWYSWTPTNPGCCSFPNPGTYPFTAKVKGSVEMDEGDCLCNSNTPPATVGTFTVYVAGVTSISPASGWQTCAGSTNTFCATAVPGGGTFSWSNGGSNSCANYAWSTGQAGTNVVTVTYRPPASVGCGSNSRSSTGVVYAVSMAPMTFTTFVGGQNTFVATGVPPGSTYVWSPAGTVSGDGRTNTVAFTLAKTNQMVAVQYGPGCSQTITGAVHRLFLSNVTFNVANSILRDDGGGAYQAPQWSATNSYPVTYPRNTTGTVSATFRVFPTNFTGSANVIIRGDGSVGGLNIPATTCTVYTSTLTTPAIKFTSAFPNQVDFLDPLTIVWKYTGVGGTAFYNAGNSANPVYITLTNPATTNLYHTVVHLACSSGHAADANAAVANTWALFAGPANVKRVVDGAKLYYYNASDGWNTATSVAGLLSGQNGNCVAWRNLLLHAFAVNGVSSDRLYLYSPGQYFLVRDWTFGTSSFTNTPPYNWKLQFATDQVDMVPVPPGSVYGDVTSSTTLAGQNSAPPAEKVFGNHRVLRYNGTWYDPSYGATFTGANHFVDNAMAGYAIRRDDLDNPPGFTNLILRAKQSAGAYQVSFDVNRVDDPSD